MRSVSLRGSAAGGALAPRVDPFERAKASPCRMYSSITRYPRSTPRVTLLAGGRLPGSAGGPPRGAFASRGEPNKPSQLRTGPVRLSRGILGRIGSDIEASLSRVIESHDLFERGPLGDGVRR